MHETKCQSARSAATAGLLLPKFAFHHNEVYLDFGKFKHGCGLFVRLDSPLYTAVGAHFVPTFDWDIEGRVCVWDAGALGLFVGVYLPTPNQYREKDGEGNEIDGKPPGYVRRKTIDDNLIQYLQAHIGRVTVVTGDFNVVQEKFDSSEAKLWTGEYTKVREVFANRFLKGLRLQDSFRVMNPKSQKFSSLIKHTKKKGEPPILARIDFMLVPGSLFEEGRVLPADVLDGPYFRTSEFNWHFKLNHLPVIVTLDLQYDSLAIPKPTPAIPKPTPAMPKPTLAMPKPKLVKVEADGAGHSKITLEWTAPSLQVTGYKVQYLGFQGEQWYSFGPSDGSTSSTSSVITGLDPGLSYRFRVRALAGAEEGPWIQSDHMGPLRPSGSSSSKRPASPHAEQRPSKM